MVDICRRVDVDTLMNSQMWGYNEFHSALLKHSDQVSLTVTKRVHFYTPGIFVDISTQPIAPSCSQSAAGLLPCIHEADIRMRSHRLLRLDDDKSATNCQETWRKLILKTFYSQAWRKLFQQLAASPQKSMPASSHIFRDMMPLIEALMQLDKKFKSSW